jgi:hypothetical protein
MAENSKRMADLAPGDRVRLSEPWSIARVVANKARMTKRVTAAGLPDGEVPEREIVFDFIDGPRRGQRDYVHGNPESKVVLA